MLTIKIITNNKEVIRSFDKVFNGWQNTECSIELIKKNINVAIKNNNTFEMYGMYGKIEQCIIVPHTMLINSIVEISVTPNKNE